MKPINDPGMNGIQHWLAMMPRSAGETGHTPPVSQRGFTLLEVMVALTITGLALGGLFGIIAGNKRLAWRAEEVLVESTQVRSLINYSQLNDQRGEISVDFVNPDLRLLNNIELEVPEQQTSAMPHALRGYEILDDSGEAVVTGSYWVDLELPE